MAVYYYELLCKQIILTFLAYNLLNKLEDIMRLYPVAGRERKTMIKKENGSRSEIEISVGLVMHKIRNDDVIEKEMKSR